MRTRVNGKNRCLGECARILEDLRPSVIERVRGMTRTLYYPKGEIIFQEGEKAFGLYIVCTGKVKLAKHAPHGKTQILKLLGPGELLGEETMFDRDVYASYARTLEDSTLHFIEREPLLELLRRHPEVALRFIRKLAQEIKGFQDKLIETSYEGSLERVSRLLLLIAAKYGIETERGLDIGMELTRQELAELAGISTETAIRILSRLRDRGLIQLEGHRIYLLDREALSDLAEPFLATLQENVL